MKIELDLFENLSRQPICVRKSDESSKQVKLKTFDPRTVTISVILVKPFNHFIKRLLYHRVHDAQSQISGKATILCQVLTLMQVSFSEVRFYPLSKTP